MTKLLTRLIISTLAALAASYLLSGVHITNVTTAVVVALVLGLFNTFLKPILVVLTIPVTIVTLGLFLIVINILIVKWVAGIVDGFTVDSWFWALMFSLVVSVVSSILEGLFGTKNK